MRPYNLFVKIFKINASVLILPSGGVPYIGEGLLATGQPHLVVMDSIIQPEILL